MRATEILVSALVTFGLSQCTEAWLPHDLLLHPGETSAGNAGFSHWSAWSSCSVTCGEGVKKRYRECSSRYADCVGNSSEEKYCFDKFCPSYLSWPRIHFSGRMIADANTVNNIRCAYENENFSAAQLSKHYIRLQKTDGTHTEYKFATSNWNPDGTNQVYFHNTNVTAFCAGPNSCSTSASIVGLEVTEIIRGVMAVLDVDWQYATELWGLSVKIPGILEGRFQTSSHQVQVERVKKVRDNTRGYSIPHMSRYKSKLMGVKWHDHYYGTLFSHAKELSIVFVYDLFDHFSREGRITGTIGLTSPDDPVETLATRTLQSPLLYSRGSAPFYLHSKQKILTIDLSYSIDGRQNGSFFASDFGALDLALRFTKKSYCRHFSWEAVCSSATQEGKIVWRWITTGGEISRRIGSDGKWYSTYGGIVNIDLKRLDRKTLRLIQRNRLALAEKDEYGDTTARLVEYPGGVVFGPNGNSIIRLDPNESHDIEIFASGYGRPLKGLTVDTHVIPGIVADAECGRESCNTTMGVPVDALRISGNHQVSKTDRAGKATFTLTAVKDPGNVRGCGLDGQVYPLGFVLRYPIKGRTWTFFEGGIIPSVLYTDYSTTTLSSAVRIFNRIKDIPCPTWDDVKDIFIQYYNLYPVMWKNGIINLHSYEDIRRKSKLLKTSMFDTDFSNPRYMPISRDLSSNKKRLIWNWMKCGMKRGGSRSESKKDKDICEHDDVKRELNEVRRLLHRAVMLELSTIPPYVTAWLSLKTEYGRNREVADIIKSVFNEEMIHMTLSANILNAVGGTVNLTDITKLPMYPTILSSGSFYELCPNMEVSLGPFSIGLVEDVFSEIERPATHRQKEVMYQIAKLWKMLPTPYEEAAFITQKATNKTSGKMLQLLREYGVFYGAGAASNPGTTSTDSRLSGLGVMKRTWHNVAEYATNQIRSLTDMADKSIGPFYTMIAVKLTKLEACARVDLLNTLEEPSTSGDRRPEGTVFTGTAKRQVNMSQWYKGHEDDIESVMREMGGETWMSSDGERRNDALRGDSHRLTRAPVFEVTGLKSALEAIVEIVYQGEGGSECSPYVTEPQLYASGKGRESKHELSHFYRFQEIVNGRRIVKANPPPFALDIVCLNASERGCPALTESGIAYCYAGERIPFHEDGVWPILHNPKAGVYEKGSLAHRLNHQFNLLYTRLLFCLQAAFGGEPTRMKTCMSTMYDLTIVGKRLVATPLGVVGDTSKIELGVTGRNGCPTWLFVREKPFRAGLPVI